MCTSGREFICPHCKTAIVICSRCDHGQRYCSDSCSQKARLKIHRAANKKYQSTPKGRLSNAARQQRFRKRQTKKVTDQGSLTSKHCVLLSAEPIAPISPVLNCITTFVSCHFCSAPVMKLE
jgi:hypothetical protein